MDKTKLSELDKVLSTLTASELLNLPAIKDTIGSVRTIVINAAPQEYQDREYSETSIWDVKVVWRGAGLYAVEARGGKHYTKDLVGGFESNPSSRTDRFKKSHRFPLSKALNLAHKLSSKLVVNGMTVAEYVLWCKADDDTVALEKQDPAGTYGREHMLKLYQAYKEEAAKL
jgi:hypothetical protein